MSSVISVKVEGCLRIVFIPPLEVVTFSRRLGDKLHVQGFSVSDFLGLNCRVAALAVGVEGDGVKFGSTSLSTRCRL